MAETRLKSLAKSFGARQAVRDLSLTIGDGELVVLLGPTGAGKTTTLRLVAGLEAPEDGSVMIGGIDHTRSTPAVRDVTFVFQQYSLYPHLSVYDNLAFPLRSPVRRTPEAEIKRVIGQVAAMLRIEDKLASRATQLSGGQMQRVAIGRALVRRPAIALLDEPLSSLDAKLRSDLRIELKRIQQDLGATMLYVTHDQVEAMTLANRIGVMDQGRLVQVGTPREVYEDPANAYVATRLGSPGINLLPRALFPNVAAPPEAITIGARTEHLTVRRARRDTGTARVKWIERLGDQNHLHIDLNNHAIVSLVEPDTGLNVGDAVDIELTRPLCFDRAGERVR